MEGWAFGQGTFSVFMFCTDLTGSLAGQVNQTISCTETVSGNTATGVSLLGYSAPDHLYRFDIVSYDGQNFSSVTFDACNADYYVYLRIYNASLNQQITARYRYGCSGRSVYGTMLEYTLPVGTYYLVVEGYNLFYGNYSVSMSCTPSYHFQGEIGCTQSVSGDTRQGSHLLGYTSREQHYMLNVTRFSSWTFSACDNITFSVYLRLYNDALTRQIAYSTRGRGCFGPLGTFACRCA